MSECEIDCYGNKEWRLNGILHREDGPTLEYHNGINEWFRNGSLHREDGPAIEFPDGSTEWWLDDERYTKEEYVLYQFSKGIIINE